MGDFLLCPDRARRAAFHPFEGVSDTDATAIGTAAHLGIEQFLLGESWHGSVTAALDWLAEQIRDKTFNYVQIKQGKTLMRYLPHMLEGWIEHVYPSIGEPDKIEGEFRHQLTASIGIEGTTDYEEVGDWLWDWKTAGGNVNLNYSKNAVRKKIQPDFYTCQRAGWQPGKECDPVFFSYGVMIKGSRPDAIIRDTKRGPGDWLWLVQRLERAVRLYETLGPDEPWPLIDNDWHCTPKWCDHWKNCKGQHVTLN